MGDENRFTKDDMSPEGKGKAVSRRTFLSLHPGAGGKANANAMEPVTREDRGGQRKGCGEKCVHPSAHRSKERSPSEKPQGLC